MWVNVRHISMAKTIPHAAGLHTANDTQAQQAETLMDQQQPNTPIKGSGFTS